MLKVSSGTNAPWKDESLLREKYCVEGLTIQEIADEWETSFDTIRYYKDKFGIEGQWGVPKSAKELTSEELSKEYWKNGKSLKKIADDHGVSQVFILRKMDELGVERRVQDQNKGTAWKDPDTLERLYWEEGLTLEEIGDKLGCSAGTVGSWMARFDIPRELTPDKKPAYFYTNKAGYEIAKSKHNGTSYSVGIHQLLAIYNGECPKDVFSNGEYHVHHKEPIPWLNTPDNIELLTASDHKAEHYKDREIDERGRLV